MNECGGAKTQTSSEVATELWNMAKKRKLTHKKEKKRKAEDPKEQLEANIEPNEQPEANFETMSNMKQI